MSQSLVSIFRRVSSSLKVSRPLASSNKARMRPPAFSTRREFTARSEEGVGRVEGFIAPEVAAGIRILELGQALT